MAKARGGGGGGGGQSVPLKHPKTLLMELSSQFSISVYGTGFSGGTQHTIHCISCTYHARPASPSDPIHLEVQLLTVVVLLSFLAVVVLQRRRDTEGGSEGEIEREKGRVLPVISVI